MKIRISFVSNSSSSSYVIAFTNQECPTCGMGPQVLVDILETLGERDHEETRLRKLNEYMEDLENEIRIDQEDLASEDVPEWYNSREEWETRIRLDLEEREEELTKIKDALDSGQKVYYVEISYHDQAFNIIFNMLQDKNYIEVLGGHY